MTEIKRRFPVGSLVDCYTEPERDTFAVWKITGWPYRDDDCAVKVELVAANDVFFSRSKVELGFSFVTATAGLTHASPLVVLALMAAP